MGPGKGCIVRPFAIFILLAFVGQASADPNGETGGSASTAVISSTRFPGDFDWDFDVDFADFLAFVSVFGKTSADAGYNPRMDMDGSGAIDFADFVTFAGVFGRTYTRPPWAADRDALIALYHATDGDSWTDRTNWLTDTNLWTWYGVRVSDGRVTRLGLPGNNLSGSIPSELSDLSNLTSLSLYDNALSGPIPSELSNLSNLRGLSLGNNALSGSIPSELGNLSNLTSLSLYGNALSGSIPSELGNLSNLTSLSLGANALSGPIPSELGNLSNLRGLSLGANALSGSIPSELSNLSNLRGLSLSNNTLSGSIPSELGNLSNLGSLWLHVNALSGPIPSELGNLSKLADLRLHDNTSLTGPLPQSLTRLTNLRHFHFYNTGLCAPLDRAFQTWLHGIENTNGSNCSGEGTLSTDRDALVALYNSTDGDSWTDRANWLTDTDLSTWRGVMVSNGRVTRLAVR